MTARDELVGLTAPGARVLALVALPQPDGTAHATVFPVVGVAAVRPAPEPARTLWSALRRLVGLEVAPERPVRFVTLMVADDGELVPVAQLVADGAAVAVVAPHWPPAEDGEHLAETLDDLRRQVEARSGRRVVATVANGRASA